VLATGVEGAVTGALHRGHVVAFAASGCPHRVQKRETMPLGSPERD
jgi:hypothetical protein